MEILKSYYLANALNGWYQIIALIIQFNNNTIVLKAGLHEVLPMISLHCHLTLFDRSAKKNILKLIQTERTLCSRKPVSWRLGLQC